MKKQHLLTYIKTLNYYNYFNLYIKFQLANIIVCIDMHVLLNFIIIIMSRIYVYLLQKRLHLD